MRPGGSTSPRIEKPGDALARAGFADQAERSRPRASENDTPSTAFTTPARGEEMRAQVRAPRAAAPLIACSRGLSWSRIWSPTRLIATISDDERDAGIDRDPVAARQHVLEAVGDQHAERRLGRPAGRGRGTRASPRARSTLATCTVATTISGGRQLGSTWRKTTRARRQRRRQRRLDVVLAALGRGGAMRGAGEIGVLRRRPARRSAASCPGRAAPTSTSASRIAGKDSCRSTMRMISASTRPPTKAASDAERRADGRARCAPAISPICSEMRSP